MAFAAIFAASRAVHAAANPSNALVLISSSSTYDAASKKLHCNLTDDHGNAIGSVDVDLSQMNFEDGSGTVSHTITVNGGSLSSSGPATDPVHEVAAVVPNGPDSVYWLFAGEHPLVDYPGSVTEGSLQNVSLVINRCKFLVTFDANGQIEDIQCQKCVYILM
jgi:hypothetical protein